MEKPTNRILLVTKAATCSAIRTLFGYHPALRVGRAPVKPIRGPVSDSFGLPEVSAVQFKEVLEESAKLLKELKRIEQLESELFPGRLSKL
jgi:hypothetical protein